MIEEQTEEQLEELLQDEALDALQGEKLPELDNIDFEKIFEVIENNQPGEHPSLRQFGGSTKDQLILEHKKRLKNLTYKEKDEYQKAMLNSMKTFVNNV